MNTCRPLIVSIHTLYTRNLNAIIEVYRNVIRMVCHVRWDGTSVWVALDQSHENDKTTTPHSSLSSPFSTKSKKSNHEKRSNTTRLPKLLPLTNIQRILVPHMQIQRYTRAIQSACRRGCVVSTQNSKIHPSSACTCRGENPYPIYCCIPMRDKQPQRRTLGCCIPRLQVEHEHKCHTIFERLHSSNGEHEIGMHVSHI